MEMPEAPKFRKLLGPSFILLGLGLGSGEIILWPYLVSNWGLSIIWAAVLGVTLQFFINMEIERYALSTGESIFVGFYKKFRYLPFWFISSTFLAWIWPGIIATSARLFGQVVGYENTNILGIGLLLLIGLVLTLGPVLYKTVEKIALVIILVGVPMIVVLALYIATKNDYSHLINGMFGFTKPLPVGLPIASFLAAFAFAGAGGNLNLAQSFYIKEKGYGMGKFGGKITSLLTGKVEEISLHGKTFDLNDGNIKRFFKWWSLINKEHLFVFWFGSIISILLLSLLAFSTVGGLSTPNAGIEFLVYESIKIGEITAPFLGPTFLIVAGIMLFNTQLTVLDATSRIMAENYSLIRGDKWANKSLSKSYYFFLWMQVIAGCVVFLLKFSQPLPLIVISAVLNAISMFVHIGLTLWVNKTLLYKEIRPNLVRVLFMIFAFIFFGYLSFRTIFNI